MPSWNLHTAHVERLFKGREPEAFGIDDVNAFLFGNYVPDIYVGFMVPDATMHIDYCVTHCALLNMIPVPDADRYWDLYIAHRAPKTPAGMSLTLGGWAHLVTDRFYNARFRLFRQTHDTPEGDELRRSKQADFDLFGRTLGIMSCVDVDDELLDAARGYAPYSILPADVQRAAKVANGIVRASSLPPDAEGGHVQAGADGEGYRMLDGAWMASVFDACDERLASWLSAWRQLASDGRDCRAAALREYAGLPPAADEFSGLSI